MGSSQAWLRLGEDEVQRANWQVEVGKMSSGRTVTRGCSVVSERTGRRMWYRLKQCSLSAMHPQLSVVDDLQRLPQLELAKIMRVLSSSRDSRSWNGGQTADTVLFLSFDRRLPEDTGVHETAFWNGGRKRKWSI